MDDELDEHPRDDDEPLWDTSGDAEALEYALSDDEPVRHRSVRLLVGGALVVVGLLAAVFAVRAATDDDGGSRQDDAAASTTSTSSTTKVGTGSGTKGSKGADATTVSAEGAATATETRWPSALAGRPPALGKQGEPPPSDAGDLEPGFYLWTDFDGWHAWLVGGSDADRLTITSDAEIAKAEPVGGDVAVDQLPNTFGFARGGADEDVVGVDFNPGYLSKTFVVTIDGDAKLHIGPRRWSAPRYFGVQKNAANT